MSDGLLDSATAGIVISGDFACVPIPMERETVERLEARAERLFYAALAASCVVLQRYHGATDDSLRVRDGNDTFLVRALLTDTTTFCELLDDVRSHPAPAAACIDVLDVLIATGCATTPLELRYRSEDCDPATAMRIAGHLATVLEAAATDPQQRVSELPLLTEAEREQLRRWNDTSVLFPSLCIHELVAAQAVETPDAAALVFESESMTYRDMERDANRLAHHLQDMGVGRGSVVGMALDRSTDLVVAVLAILKAGAAYLPLDPAYPRDRLAFMLEDAQVGLVITHSALVDMVPSHDGALLVLDEEASVIARRPSSVPVVEVDSDDVAYVMYTSGSTGRPKGVVVPHRGVVNLATVGTDSLCSQPGTRVLQFHSPSFDPSMMEMMLALAHGKTLVLAPRERLMPGPALVELLSEQQIEILVLPASALAVLPVVPLPSLKMIFLEGEAPAPEVVARWSSGRRVFNAYGPTEASMWCVGTYIDGTESRVPIGRPIANARIHILDPSLQEVPVGVAGEIHIGGVGIAHGYLDRADLTAERFIRDPFAQPGSRLYKTGDIGRYRPDGVIDFLGRVDGQVKVRGYRVEPGEIESAILRTQAVVNTVVVAQQSGAGHKRLVAYCVPATPPLDGAALREELRKELPEYMVPSVLVDVDRLPRLPNGKLDRSALPPVIEASEAVCSAPRTVIESTVATVWQDALEVPLISPETAFSDAGGDSLLAVLVVTAIEERFGVVVPVSELVAKDMTIRALASRIAKGAQGRRR